MTMINGVEADDAILNTVKGASDNAKNSRGLMGTLWQGAKKISAKGWTIGGPGIIAGSAGAATLGVSAYTRRTREGKPDWNRSFDGGLLATEAAGIGAGILTPGFIGKSWDAVTAGTDRATWAGGKGVFGSALSNHSLGHSILGSALGGFVGGGSVFGDSKRNTFNWQAAGYGAAALGLLGGVAHIRTGRWLKQSFMTGK